MSAANPVDLSKIVLILGSFVGVEDILKLSDNSRYEFRPPAQDAVQTWKGDQPEAEVPSPPFLCLTIGQHMFDPQGWVCGSHGDSDRCDLQVATTNQTGISRRFIRFDISPRTHEPRVSVLSDKTIRLRAPGNVLICRPGEPMEIRGPVTLDLGAVTFRAWIPKRTVAERRQYTRFARTFSQDAMLALPKYLPPIHSQSETAKHNVRYGRNNTVYVAGWGIESRGMHASVMMVKERTTGLTFGAKEPYYRSADSPDVARKRFEILQKEYEYTIKLNDPHIVKAYDIVLAEDETLPPWMIVEYIPLNLRDAMADLEEGDRITAMTHLFSALYYMHRHGVTHRDVKPDNVLVRRDSRGLTFKLADFGTVKHNRSAEMDTFTGTELYMAPELFSTPRRYTDKVDLWALGLIGVQLLTLWHPCENEWDRHDFGPWMRGIVLPRIPEAPSKYQPLLRGLLRKKPETRWSALRCLDWMRRNSPTLGDDTKRPVLTLDQVYEEDSREGYRRSPHPSLSTTRTRAAQTAEERSYLQDQQSPATLGPGLPSAAPTPRGDEDAALESSDGGESQEEDCTVQGDDWDERAS